MRYVEVPATMDDAPMVPLIWHERPMQQMRTTDGASSRICVAGARPSFLDAPRSA
ncbi:MAG: hypothetical protein CM15mP79_2860 [Methanobacteriota archaeon]|nr:MAG: hypothetical protein CM15mP79_2860 [Euryarchaeota archaeon]